MSKVSLIVRIVRLHASACSSVEKRARMEAEKAVRLRDNFLSIAATPLITPIRKNFQVFTDYFDSLGANLPKAALLRRDP